LNRITRSLSALFLLALIALPSPGSAKGLSEEIDIEDGGEMASWDYSPASLTITAGTTVLWRNNGTQTHSVTSQDQLFDSRLLDANKAWSHTFETSGTYRYFCVPHPWMKGTIVVRPAEEERSTNGRDQAETRRDAEETEDEDGARDGERDTSPDGDVRAPTATATATPSPTLTPTATSTATPSPTSTPTPTSTTAPLFPFFTR
jgi:plastocyanin